MHVAKARLLADIFVFVKVLLSINSDFELEESARLNKKPNKK